jgi:hypothetical protein
MSRSRSIPKGISEERIKELDEVKRHWGNMFPKHLKKGEKNKSDL